MPNRVLFRPLTKDASGSSGTPGPVSPTYWDQSSYQGAQIAQPSLQRPAAPTGTYPKHYWSTGPGVGPGALATKDARAGIMPGLPGGLSGTGPA